MNEGRWRHASERNASERNVDTCGVAGNAPVATVDKGVEHCVA